MMANTIEVKAQSFKDTVEKGGIVLLDWWASWCPPCRAFAPVFEAAAEKHSDLTWGKINTEEEQELAAAFNIQSIPTLMVFRDGILLFEQAGALPAPMLEKLVTEIRALDMDEVRKKIAEHDKGGGEQRAE